MNRNRALLFLLIVLILAGCARKGAPPEQIRPAGKGSMPAKMGFSIQAGAFSKAENAAKLTVKLNREGLSAYYFVYKTGLYKVRFGNFKTAEAATERARRLVDKGIIEEFWIVNPREYSIALKEEKGEQYVRDEIVRTARSFIGVPYLWGGDSADEGFDCSGFTMAIYQYNGLLLPHSSREQSEMGAPVSKGSLEKGDLVFFTTNNSGSVSHVGVYVGGGRFIHAPGRGKKIGIESLDSKYYIKHYAGGRSLM
ncbi:MAG TPA: NlpC/P60 family protein [Syntrophales bacterium]|nr:NlpC/P60 family protein [Syntrophales bacterium]